MRNRVLVVSAIATLASACGNEPRLGATQLDAVAGERTLEADQAINRALAQRGARYALAYAEFIGPDGEPGGIIIAKNVGNKQLGAHFVPMDPRRGGSVDIAYITDLTEGAARGGLTPAQTNAEIDRAMATWDAEVCSAGLQLTNLGAYPFDFGVVQNLLGFGGFPGVFADVTHAGWLKREFFDALTPGCVKGSCGGDFILGVTFTFVFGEYVGDQFVPSDIDRNGKLDVAFREIYYNDNFNWRTGPWTGGNDFDAFSVILHEVGHGLSQAHFGNISINPAGNVLFSPDAVMNAVVSRRFMRTGLLGTDRAGHCSIWGAYPLQ